MLVGKLLTSSTKLRESSMPDAAATSRLAENSATSEVSSLVTSMTADLSLPSASTLKLMMIEPIVAESTARPTEPPPRLAKETSHK